MPPATNTAVRAALLWRVRFPDGPSILTAAPSGIAFRTRLNAVARRRVATIRVSLVRSAGERKRARISFGIRFGGIEQCHVETLTRLKCPVRRLLKAERDGTFGDFLLAGEFDQCGRRCRVSAHCSEPDRILVNRFRRRAGQWVYRRCASIAERQKPAKKADSRREDKRLRRSIAEAGAGIHQSLVSDHAS